MDPITQQTVLAAAGAAGGGPVYVDDVFSTDVYTGTGSSKKINNGIDNTSNSLIWIKCRNDNERHHLEGPLLGLNKYLNSNETYSELTSLNSFTSFDDDGFTLGTDGSTNQVNKASKTYVSWNFKAAPGFFDVVTYSGSNSVQTIPHSLGSEPGMILIKNLTTSIWWAVYHRSLATDKYLRLNESGGVLTSTAIWNQTRPTSTEFTVGVNGQVNGDGSNFVAYIFAHDDQSFGTDSDESIIKCGSYTPGGSNTAETVINLGFEPQWLLIKRSDNTSSWYIVDNIRGFPVSVTTNFSQLTPDNNDPEYTSNNGPAITSTGFIANDFLGGSSADVIYVAIRRPNKPPEVATDVFAMDTFGGGPPAFTSGFPVDLGIGRNYSSNNNWNWSSRLTSGKELVSNSTGDESSNSSNKFDFQDGWYNDSGTYSTYESWMFKRAPGFMDVVAYSGNGSSSRAVTHNLGVVPEIMIIKRRNNSEGWQVYVAGIGPTKTFEINSNAMANVLSGRWNGAPTSTHINLSNGAGVNSTGSTYIAYLFATLSGISKVGSYDGSSSDINIDCGFTNGARFVLIKRTDNNGDWCLFDTLRGLVSGNDPLLTLNSQTAQDSGNDLIDPLSSGFTVVGGNSFVNNVNAGATYIFLAIA